MLYTLIHADENFDPIKNDRDKPEFIVLMNGNFLNVYTEDDNDAKDYYFIYRAEHKYGFELE